MNSQRSFISTGTQQTHPDVWSHNVLGDQNFWTARGLLAAWHRLTAPPDPPPGATFRQRDRVRRGRITSSLMLFLGVLLLVLVVPIGILGPNHTILGVAISGWVWIVVSSFINRKGHVTLAALVMYLSVNGGLLASILHLSFIPFHVGGALTPDDKDIFYLLIYGDVFLGAMLSPSWVIVPVVINIAFSLAELYFGSHTPALAAMLATGSLFIIAFRIVNIHLLAPGVVWVLGKHGQEGVKRADRAEEVARLNHDLVTLQESQAQQAEHLQQMTNILIEVLNQVAHGQLDKRVPFDARVPFIEGETFWPLVGTLNTLLSRYQRASLAEQELERLRSRFERYMLAEHLLQRITAQQAVFNQAVTKALQEHKPLQLPITSTPLDLFYKQLNGKYIAEPVTRPLSAKSPSY